VRPSLWAKLKPYALQTADHLAELGEHRKQFVTFLVSISVDGAEAFTLEETRAFLKKLTPADLASVAFWLESRVGGADEASWPAIEAWIAAAWPKELAAQSSEVSQALAKLPTLVPARFPEIVSLVMDLIGPIEHGHRILEELAGKSLDTLHPKSALVLLDRITPDEPTPWFGDLKGALQRIALAAPDITGSPQYVRLLQISTKAGI
jgi:hypothetical protein